MEYMTDVLGIISDTLDISHGTEGPGKEDMVLFAESAPSGQVAAWVSDIIPANTKTASAVHPKTLPKS